MPLIASRAADSAFALGFGQSSLSAPTSGSWLTTTQVSTSSSVTKTCTDSSGNVYWSINDGSYIYLQKASLNGTIIWQKQIGIISTSISSVCLALKTDESILYLSFNSTPQGSSNSYINITSVYASSGEIVSNGTSYYFNTPVSYSTALDYSPNATDGKNLIISLLGRYSYSYPSLATGAVLTVNPSNFSSYEMQRAFVTYGGIAVNVFNSTKITGGNTVVKCWNSANKNGIQSLYQGYPQYSKSTLGDLPSYGVASDSSGNVYSDFYTYTGFGIQKHSTDQLNPSWAIQFNIDGFSNGTAVTGTPVCVDSDSNIYCVANIKNSTGNYYAVLVKVNPSGTVLWIKKFYNDYNQSTSGGQFYGASVSAKGNYVCVGIVFTPNYYPVIITLTKDGALVNDTYIGNSSVGNLTISTPSYSVTGLSASYSSWGGEGSDSASSATTATVSSITSTPSSYLTFTKVLLPFS